MISPTKQLIWEDLVDLWQKSRKYWAALALVALEQLAMGKDLKAVLAVVYAALLQILIGLVDRFLKESKY